MTVEWAYNWLKYGERGDYIESDKMNIRLERKDDFLNTIPRILVIDTKKHVVIDVVHGNKAIDLVREMLKADGEYEGEN